MSFTTKTLMAAAVAGLTLIAAGDFAEGHNRADPGSETRMARGPVFAVLARDPAGPALALEGLSREAFETRWTAGFPEERRVAAAVAERRETQSASASDCRRQAWPYVSRDCVVAGEGAAPRGPVRTIALDRVERTGLERR